MWKNTSEATKWGRKMWGFGGVLKDEECVKRWEVERKAARWEVWRLWRRGERWNRRTFVASEEEREGVRVAPPNTATAESIPISLSIFSQIKWDLLSQIIHLLVLYSIE